MSKQDIQLVREYNEWRRGSDNADYLNDDYPTRLGIALDNVVAMAERYEKLRILNVTEFRKLQQRNLAGENFDDMVDALLRSPA
jgi:hypothetical protein